VRTYGVGWWLRAEQGIGERRRAGSRKRSLCEAPLPRFFLRSEKADPFMRSGAVASFPPFSACTQWKMAGCVSSPGMKYPSGYGGRMGRDDPSSAKLKTAKPRLGGVWRGVYLICVSLFCYEVACEASLFQGCRAWEWNNQKEGGHPKVKHLGGVSSGCSRGVPRG